jgi:hypothetical protein
MGMKAHCSTFPPKRDISKQAVKLSRDGFHSFCKGVTDIRLGFAGPPEFLHFSVSKAAIQTALNLPSPNGNRQRSSHAPTGRRRHYHALERQSAAWDLARLAHVTELF